MSIGRLFTATATVQTYLGSNNAGEMLAAAVDLKCFVMDDNQIVLGATGDEVTSTRTLYAPLSDFSAYAPRSVVTVDGTAARVLTAARKDVGPSGVRHCEIHLT